MHSPPPASIDVNTTGDKNLEMAETLPPSPTYSDAVTAPEGDEDLTQDKSSPVTGKENTIDLSDTATSYPNLGAALSSFLGKIAPWSGMMPEHLLQDMRYLGDIAAEMRQPRQKVKPRLARFTYEVHRLSMDDWYTDAPFVDRDPIPVILTYTKTDKPGSASTEQTSLPVLLRDMPRLKLYEDGSRLQRVQINSYYLYQELCTITGISIRRFPIFMASPFKLLLEYIPQIEHRWAVLKDEMQKMQAEWEHSKIERAADPSLQTGRLDNSGDERTTDASSISDEFHEDEREYDSKLAVLSEKVSQLKCLLDFIQAEPDLQRTIDIRARVEAGTLEAIRFSDIWLLFSPGDVVVSRESDRWQLRRVYSTTGGQVQRGARGRHSSSSNHGRSAWTGTTFTPEEDGTERVLREANFGIGSWTPLKVDCYTLRVARNEIRPVDWLCKIKHFLGERKITDLPIYPVRFHPDSAGLLDRMQCRGLKFLKSPGYKCYRGPSVPSRENNSARNIDGDVYVEFPTETHECTTLEMCEAEVTESEEELRADATRWLVGNEVDAKRSEKFMAENRVKLDMITVVDAKKSIDHLRFLPWAIGGYVFRLRDWVDLDIDLLQDIDRRPEARDISFNELVIPDKTRALLVSLVEEHACKVKACCDTTETTDVEGRLRPQVDLVRGKGQGLIILLHGPPGSGKTSTAETIAAYTQRPLYSITCGDLGLTATEVEKNLSAHTERAESWGCVLLLDEADVFLMQRNWQDMERNALVSVFLRELEYYSGILFLTTNRPGVIDEAFLSRIHMAFRYPAVDLASTTMMWNNIMDRIERDNQSSHAELTVTFKRDQLLRFAEKDFLRRERTAKPWNGRQIRNAFNTAIGLGRYQRLRMLDEQGISPEEAAASGKKQLMEIKLTKTNFQDISTAAKSFEDYIQDLRGVDSDIARLTRVRDDHWGSEGPVAVKDYSNIRNTTMPEPGVSSRSPPARVGSAVRDPGQLRVQPNQVTLTARSSEYTSEDSDDPSSDDG